MIRYRGVEWFGDLEVAWFEIVMGGVGGAVEVYMGKQINCTRRIKIRESDEYNCISILLTIITS